MKKMSKPIEVNVVINCDTGAIMEVSSSKMVVVNLLLTHENELQLHTVVSTKDIKKFHAEVEQLKDLSLL